MFSVTIGVTCKNSKKTIKQCVDSLLNLSYPKNKYKIFVVDSFSNDGTYEILQRYSKRIKVEQIRSNIAGGHNYIIKNSHSEIIALTDADCVVDKNWLRELVKPFEDKDVGATTGLVRTPKNVNMLQLIIGNELEARYDNFPQFVSRAPTMNLAFRAKLAKKVLFDEIYDVAQETDWGYRFTNKNRMMYVPGAIVYHYHRATWWNFFKQQFKYAEFVPLVYFKHKKKMLGDHISKPSMLLNIINLYLIFLTFSLSIFYDLFLYAFLFLFALFLFTLIIDFLKLKTRKYFLYFILIFFIRTLAWCIGLIFSIRNLLRFKDSL